MQTPHVRLASLFPTLALALCTLPAHAQSWSDTTRVSVSSTGAEANDVSLTHSDANLSLGSNGRFVAFNSLASNLVAADTNGAPDVFVHDLQLGITQRVSVSSSGQQGNGDGNGRGSYGTALSADGRFVGFDSYSSNLVPGDSGFKRDVFVHDRSTGTTERVSVSTANKSPNGESQGPTLSADARFVLFDSSASNLVDGDRNKQWDVFLRDRWTGATVRVSVSSTGKEGNAGSIRWFGGSTLSADGRCAAFYSWASNLVPGDTNAASDVFVRDLWSGTTERISVTSYGVQANGPSQYPSLSADGRFVGFATNAANLLPPGATSGSPEVYVHDRLLHTTQCASVSTTGEPVGSVYHALSADGRYVAFATGSPNVVPGDTNGLSDVFVRDLELGTTIRLADTDGALHVAMDGPGHTLAFDSSFASLVPGDTNGVRDVFVIR